jgi:tetratricopeptide (TPR) repeat protein
MKHYAFLPVLILLFVWMALQVAMANDNRYLEAMKKNLAALQQAKTTEELQQVINGFERIAQAEKNRWEPQYYIAFTYVMMANREKETAKKDAYLDQAEQALVKLRSVDHDASEGTALEGFIYTIRVSVDPGSRGPQLAPKAMQLLEKAVALNPENPRALGLLAQMQFGTAQFFGSSTDEACQKARAALEKFESSATENPIAPQWGKPMVEGLLKQCK